MLHCSPIYSDSEWKVRDVEQNRNGKAVRYAMVYDMLAPLQHICIHATV